MKNYRLVSVFLMGAMLILSACSPAVPNAAGTSGQGATPTTTANSSPTSEPYQPAWLSEQLVDTASGNSFTLDDYQGKLVLVELMATWCPNCYWQQQQIQALQKLDGYKDVVFISMSVDKNDDAAVLKKYAHNFGFTWTFTIASQNIIQDLTEAYGPQMVNPPATPMFLIDQSGDIHALPLGAKKTEDLDKFVHPFLKEPVSQPVESASPTAVADWLTTPLVDVNSGDTFTLSDFKGKVVLVEVMATWCPTCFKQARDIKTLKEKLNHDDLVIVSLDLDFHEAAEDIKSYSQQFGFTWYYATPSLVITRAIGNTYGALYIDPTASPILIIDRNGEVYAPKLGEKNNEILEGLVTPFLES